MAHIKFDPLDLDGVISLIREYGEYNARFYGKNTEGETVIIWVSAENVSLITFQKNDWIRTNIYYPDGTVEELFEK